MSTPANLPVVPKYDNIDDANKAVEEMFWAIQFADAFLVDLQDTISAAKLSQKYVAETFAYSNTTIKTQRAKLAKALRVAAAYALQK